jgi:hypothetical protein
MAAATLRRLVALALTRASGHGPQAIAAPDLVAPVPEEHADHRSSI